MIRVLALVVLFLLCVDSKSALPCDHASCMTRAFQTCGVGRGRSECRKSYVSNCRAQCTHVTTTTTEEITTTHAPCDEATCIANAFTICGVGDQFLACRRRYVHSCREACSPTSAPRTITTVNFGPCNLASCTARSFVECGTGVLVRDCRSNAVSRCIASCNGKTPHPGVAILGCNHHSCSAKAESQCGFGPGSSACRGRIYTQCRGDGSSCLAQSYTVCGVGTAMSGCRSRFTRRCERECSPATTTTQATTTAPAVTTTPAPCNEEVCMEKAYAFCGGDPSHERCNREHFRYCMMQCPLPAATSRIATTAAAAAAVDTTVVVLPSVNSSVAPCSDSACRGAAAILCGSLPSARTCRATEYERCKRHCATTLSRAVTSTASTTAAQTTASTAATAAATPHVCHAGCVTTTTRPTEVFFTMKPSANWSVFLSSSSSSKSSKSSSSSSAWSFSFFGKSQSSSSTVSLSDGVESCDDVKLFHMFDTCQDDACRDGVRSFMGVCESQRKGILRERQAALKTSLAACTNSECKVVTRRQLAHIQVKLLKVRISSLRVHMHQASRTLTVLRGALDDCENDMCKKTISVRLVEALEDVRISRQRLTSRSISLNVVRAGQRVLSDLSHLLMLRGSALDCASNVCRARILRKIRRWSRRVKSARHHLSVEKALFRTSRRVLRSMQKQARITIALAKCTSKLCGDEMRTLLKRVSRRIRHLQAFFLKERKAVFALRHRLVSIRALRKFEKIRQKLIVKRAGCASPGCFRFYSRRIQMYNRILKRIHHARYYIMKRARRLAEKKIAEHAEVLSEQVKVVHKVGSKVLTNLNRILLHQMKNKLAQHAAAVAKNPVEHHHHESEASEHESSHDSNMPAEDEGFVARSHDDEADFSQHDSAAQDEKAFSSASEGLKRRDTSAKDEHDMHLAAKTAFRVPSATVGEDESSLHEAAKHSFSEDVSAISGAAGSSETVSKKVDTSDQDEQDFHLASKNAFKVPQATTGEDEAYLHEAAKHSFSEDVSVISGAAGSSGTPTKVDTSAQDEQDFHLATSGKRRKTSSADDEKVFEEASSGEDDSDVEEIAEEEDSWGSEFSSSKSKSGKNSKQKPVSQKDVEFVDDNGKHEQHLLDEVETVSQQEDDDFSSSVAATAATTTTASTAPTTTTTTATTTTTTTTSTTTTTTPSPETAVPLTVPATVVEATEAPLYDVRTSSCADRAAFLHERLSEALRENNEEQAREIEEEMHELDCTNDERTSCMEFRDRVENVRANINLELSNLYEQISNCQSDQCRLDVTKDIHALNRRLALIKTPTC